MRGAPALAEKFAVERGEQPRLCLGGVAQLVTFRGPPGERLLDKIARVRLVPAERKSEAIERLIVFFNQAVEVQVGHNRINSAGPAAQPVNKCPFPY